MGSWGIQISTGGGTDIPTSTQSQFFTYVVANIFCPLFKILTHVPPLDVTIFKS